MYIHRHHLEWKIQETTYLSSVFVLGYSVGLGFILSSSKIYVRGRVKESRNTPTFPSL